VQVTPDRYRRADLLPVGGVLVVGASATGVQLAAEIHASGRPVTLAAGRHVRLPRRYRGRDIMRWLDAGGVLADPRPADIAPGRLLRQPSMQLVGSRDHRDIDLYRLRDAGVRVLGRAEDGAGRTVRFGGGLAADCVAAEGRRDRLLARIDAHIAARGLAAPEDPAAHAVPAPLEAADTQLDLRAEAIRTVVWATGYRREYPWLRVPVLDSAGEIVQRDGATPAPGLFVVGLPFMRHRASTFIDGAGRDAAAVAAAIARALGAPAAAAA
jgi:putative flavoprotein involved in K+ transport